MKAVPQLALFVLAVIFVAAICADALAPASYETQFRQAPNAPPSR